MNRGSIPNNWKKIEGHIRENWRKFSDDDIAVIEGQRNQLTGKIQQRYGISEEEAVKQVVQFQKTITRNISY